MNSKYTAIALSLLSGFFIAIMVILNASLGGRIGILESSFVVHLVGALSGVIVVALFLRTNRLRHMAKAPKYLLSGGVMGVAAVLISNAVVPRLGMLLTTGLFLTGNLIAAVVIDHFGLFCLPLYKISWRRTLGLLSAITGLILVLQK